MFLQPANKAEEVEVGVATGESGTWIGNGIETDDAAVLTLVGIRRIGSGRVDLGEGSIEDLGLDIVRIV